MEKDMKLRKFIKTTIHEYLNEQMLNGSNLSIPKTKLNGTFYHGSIVSENDDLFGEFGLGYSDWDAIWLADNETVAENFSDWRGGYDDNETKVVFRVKINVNSIADISYELSERINEIWALSDFREAIPLLKQRDFNGWVTTGSLDRIEYNDIAIFNPNQINVQDVKIFINDNWTEFMNINDAQDLIEKHREGKNKIKRMLR